MPFSDVIGHERQKAILRAAIQRERVAHAYLFYGEPAIGKRLIALRLAQALCCESPPAAGEADACGRCRSCTQIERGVFPDFVSIGPDQDQANPQIKIEQIRALEEQLIYRPLVAARRVVIIDDADRMTLGAANALLKTLEEPPGHSILLLITSRFFALPMTIRSRCQRLRFAAPSKAEVEQALVRTRGLSGQEAGFLSALTHNRLGEALTADLVTLRSRQQRFAALTAPAALRSPAAILTTADGLHREERSPEALEWLAGWIRDLVLVSVGGDPDRVLNADQIPQLTAAARQARIDALLALHEDIDRVQRNAHRNVNLQLTLENLLLRLRDALATTAASPSRS